MIYVGTNLTVCWSVQIESGTGDFSDFILKDSTFHPEHLTHRAYRRVWADPVAPSIMATQAALIADTIVGMKRALRRERDGELAFSVLGSQTLLLTPLPRADNGPDDPITQPTNRGNKMRANAKYVREGAMGFINAEDLYREVRDSCLEQGSTTRVRFIVVDKKNRD